MDLSPDVFNLGPLLFVSEVLSWLIIPINLQKHYFLDRQDRNQYNMDNTLLIVRTQRLIRSAAKEVRITFVIRITACLQSFVYYQ